MEDRYSRRDFLHLGAMAAAGLVLLGRAGRLLAKALPVPKGMQPVPESDPVAQSLGYKPNAKEVDRAKFPSRQPNQLCKNCSFYTPVNSGWGKCQVIQSGVVAAGGWCASWSPKK